MNFFTLNIFILYMLKHAYPFFTQNIAWFKRKEKIYLKSDMDISLCIQYLFYSVPVWNIKPLYITVSYRVVALITVIEEIASSRVKIEWKTKLLSEIVYYKKNHNKGCYKRKHSPAGFSLKYLKMTQNHSNGHG